MARQGQAKAVVCKQWAPSTYRASHYRPRPIDLALVLAALATVAFVSFVSEDPGSQVLAAAVGLPTIVFALYFVLGQRELRDDRERPLLFEDGALVVDGNVRIALEGIEDVVVTGSPPRLRDNEVQHAERTVVGLRLKSTKPRLDFGHYDHVFAFRSYGVAAKLARELDKPRRSQFTFLGRGFATRAIVYASGLLACTIAVAFDLPILVAALFATLVCVSLALLHRVTFIVGDDGLQIRTRGSVRYIDYRNLSAWRALPGGSGIRLAEGTDKPFSLRLLPLYPRLGRVVLDLRALLESVDTQRGIQDAKSNELEGRAAAILAAWLDENESNGVPYRRPELTEERVLAMLGNSSLPTALRIAVVKKLVARHPVSARTKLRLARDRVADPAVRLVLDEALADASPEDDGSERRKTLTVR